MIAEVTRALGLLVDRGMCDATLVVPHTLGPTPVEDDTKASLALMEALARERPDLPVFFLDEDLAPAELAALYGQMACMVAVRLHAAILAMLSGTPTFAISYFTHKTQGVMNGVGQGACVADFATVSGDHIATVLTSRIGSQPYRDALARVCLENRRILEARCVTWVAECLQLDPVGESVSPEQARTE